MLRTKSICSSVVATAASPASVAGTNTDQNCAPTLPCASLGRSVWVKLTGAAMSVRTASGPALRSCQGRSLCPSMSGERASKAVAASRWLVTGPAYAAPVAPRLSRWPLPARPRSFHQQNASPVDPVSRQVGQRLIGLIKRVRGGGDLDRQALRQGEELGRVTPGVGGNAAQVPLLEQELVVV